MPGRKFVFAHILLPHPPYVFDANGNMVVKATAEVQPEAELYADQLAFANSQVKQTVDALLAGPPESDPIIIIMGDEGPFLCRNVDCVDPSVRRLGIRFGVLAAYYLPDQPAGFFPPDHTHVNTFRMLFDAYFGTDLPVAARPFLRLAGQRPYLRLPGHHRPAAAARQQRPSGRRGHATHGHARCARQPGAGRGSRPQRVTGAER